MQQLTETQLNAKINAFLTARFEDHPDILAMDMLPEARLSRESIKEFAQGLLSKTLLRGLSQQGS